MKRKERNKERKKEIKKINKEKFRNLISQGQRECLQHWCET